MQPFSLGKISVATPGTPVPLTTNATLMACRVRIESIIGEAGRVFLGVQGMNKATLAGVIKQFWPTGVAGPAPAIPVDSWQAIEEGGDNTIQLSRLFVDANTANEGVVVEYWQS